MKTLLAGTVALTLMAPWVHTQAALFPVLEPRSPAPPAPPPILERAETGLKPSALRSSAALVYTIGDPTPEEQLYVEMINRARADAAAESLLFYNADDPAIRSAYDQWEVDLELMLTEFAALPTAQPLAINPLLTEAARRQTQDMLENVFQDHQGSDGSMPWDRVDDTGYNWSTVGENIYARARSVFHGHAGFEVDWGPGEGGMQTGRGHRTSIHNGEFREIGVGVILGTNEAPPEPPVGPQLVTQVFATAQGSTPFITGVAYYDLNGNNFYDLGEGIGGVRVQATGTGMEAVTARSGGYALPVAGNGTYTVTFSGEGFAAVSEQTTVQNGQNMKLDFTPAYEAPVISGTATPAVGQPNTYTFSEVGGAEEYAWRSFQKLVPAPEGAENGTAQVSIEQSSGYAVLAGDFKAGGSFAFHLAHPEPAKAQSVTWQPSFLVGSDGAMLTFQSRLGYATADEHAEVQLSMDEGANWAVIWSQSGSGGAGETSFSMQTIDLSSHAGQTISLRFVYDFQGGSYFPGADPAVGWWFDDVELSGVHQMSGVEIGVATDGSFLFVPGIAGEYGLQVRARTGHDFLPWGPIYTVAAEIGSGEPAFRIGTTERVENELQLQVEVVSGTIGSADLVVESASEVDGPWAVTAASITEGLDISIPMGESPARFYRVRFD